MAADTGSVENTSGAAAAAVNFEQFARALGLGLSQMTLYGAKHTVTRDAVTSCHAQILSACTSEGEINLSWPERDLIINGRVVPQRNSLVQALVTKLQSAEIMGLSFRSGVTQEEFNSLLQILSASTEGERPSNMGLEEALKHAGITHVKVKEIKYAAVEEGQVISNQVDIGKGSELESAALNVFQSGGSGPSAEGTRALEAAIKDPSRMSDMIVESAKQGTNTKDVELLASRILTNLKKGCEALLGGEEAKTAKGKRALSHNLSRLEAELLERTPGSIPASCEQGISFTIGKTVDTLMTESLVDEYARQRDAMRANEQRLVRFLKSKEEGDLDIDFLRQQAKSMGLSEAELQSILRQGGMASAADVLPSGSQLAGLIHQVQNAAPLGGTSSIDQERMLGILQEVESQVGLLMEATDSKINALEAQLASTKGEDGAATPLDSAETMRVLAEITQELCQPLSVVSCSIDMVKDQRLGPLQQSQSDMLDLASTSSQRLLTLINKLGEITGMPDTLHPQQDILKNLYA